MGASLLGEANDDLRVRREGGLGSTVMGSVVRRRAEGRKWLASRGGMWARRRRVEDGDVEEKTRGEIRRRAEAVPKRAWVRSEDTK